MTRRRTVPVQKKPVTWILVADGRKAQVYVRSLVEKRIPMSGNSIHPHYQESIINGIIPVEAMAWQVEEGTSYETGMDKLGRVFESKSSAHHMHEPPVDIHDQLKRRFMRSVAEKINAAKREKAFDRLILVAPARMLGELRSCLDVAVQQAVIAELAKDMTHYEEQALAEHLNQIA